MYNDEKKAHHIKKYQDMTLEGLHTMEVWIRKGKTFRTQRRSFSSWKFRFFCRVETLRIRDTHFQ